MVRIYPDGPAKKFIMESTVSLTPLFVAPSSLAEAFTQVPDPRRAASVRYPLPVLLALTVAAILSGQQSVLAITEWGAGQAPDLLGALGLPAEQRLRQSTVHRLFAKLDGRAVGAALAAAIAPGASPTGETDLKGVAIDGKAQRGRVQFESAASTVLQRRILE